MTHIRRSHNAPDLFHRTQVRAKPSMHTEYLVFYNSDERETVEAINECLPEPDIIPSFTFIIESVDAIDGCAFMIPSQNEKVLRILDLVG